MYNSEIKKPVLATSLIHAKKTSGNTPRGRTHDAIRSILA